MEIINHILRYGCLATFIEYFPEATETNVMLVGLACALLCMVSAYLLGSINFAIVLSKLRGDDIRKHGSQNAGTTNMLRTYGKRAAIVTLIGDFLKGTVASLIGAVLFGVYGKYLAALFCVLGHVFPVYYKFKGGKGIATAAGTILVCKPIVLLILLVIFATVLAISKFVSLASITVALLYPFILDRVYKLFPPYEGYTSGIHILFVFILAMIVLWKHYPNMKRLMSGTESKISFKKKSEAKAETEAEDNTDGEDQGDK